VHRGIPPAVPDSERDVTRTSTRTSTRTRGLAALGALALLAGVLVPSAQSPASANGCDLGTRTVGSDTFFTVTSATDLAKVGTDCPLDGKYLQTAGITLPAPTGVAASNLTPIGESGSPFTGTYDGDGHTITGLTIDIDDNDIGLFGLVGAAGVLRNIRLVDADVIGDENVGALVGVLQGTVENSSSSGSVKGGFVVGGLVGAAEGASSSIVRSFSTADVEGDEDRIGGLVGWAYTGASISDAYARGSVMGGDSAGGLVGYLLVGPPTIDFVELLRVYSTGEVSGDDDLGGLIGARGNGTFTITAAFWDTETSKQSTSAGGSGVVGRTTAQMKLRSTFDTAGWAIVDGWAAFDAPSAVWGICEAVNDGYPFLLWEFTEDPCGSDEEPPQQTTGPSTPVLVGGVPPVVPTGTGAWVQTDGSSTPLAVSSPGVNQLRYAADGIEVTFTGGSGSSVANGLVADANGEIVCEVCVQLAAGQVIEVWMFSTPRLVAAHLTEDLPCQRFSVPVVAPLDGGGPVSAGAHTLQLALPTASGMQAVNVGVTVGGPVPASVPAGEGGVPMPLALLLAAIASVAGAVLVGRRALAIG
jgi:hypothetical protein